MGPTRKNNVYNNRSCELFTYDSRYYYDDNQFKRKLKFKKIDLENITDNRVVCSPHAREVCLLLLELIDIKAEVVDEAAHGKVKLQLYHEDFIMDASRKLDFMRVKLKRNTRGFYPLERRKGYTDSLEMKRIDQRIKYIEEDYFNIENAIPIDPRDSIVSKYYKIKDFLRQCPNIISENDASKVIAYLENYLLASWQYEHISKVNLFQDCMVIGISKESIRLKKMEN